jgi:hypothetical protein
VLHLTEEEYAALEDARRTLNQAGSEVTLDQLIHRVFADWMVRVRAVVQPAPQEPQAAPRDERMHARLRDFLAAPIKTWRGLAKQMLHSAFGAR